MEAAAARWSLGLLSSPAVVAVATDTLVAGGGGEATVMLAGMSDPLDRDLHAYVPEFFREQGCAVPPPPQAAKILVDAAVKSIEARRRHIVEAGLVIDAVFNALNDASEPKLCALADQLRDFEMAFAIAAGEQWEDPALESALLADVDRLLQRGGFTIA